MYSYTPLAAPWYGGADKAGVATGLSLGKNNPYAGASFDNLFDTPLYGTSSYNYYAQGQALADSWGRF
jgi:hypothetical protein